MSYLGEELFREGKYDHAERILRRVILESTKLFGPRAEETYYNTGLLAEFVQGQGKLPEAEKLLRQALEGEGDTHGGVLAMKIADSLGAVLRDEGNFDEAEMWIRKSLIGRENLLGPTHLETLRSVNHLALLPSKMDCPEEAELLLQK